MNSLKTTLSFAKPDEIEYGASGKHSHGEINVQEAAGYPHPGVLQRLPLRLRPLPSDRIIAVKQALMILEEAGLREVPSTKELRTAATAALTDDDATDYRHLCSWCRTPALWRAAVGRVDALVGCSLWGRSGEEAAALRAQVAEEQQEARHSAAASDACQQSAPDAEALKRARRCAERSRFWQGEAPEGRDHFERWWAAMLEADEQIRCLGAGGYQPRTLGEGPAALFYRPERPWPAPPPSVRRRAPGAPSPASAAAAALVLGSPAQPRRRVGHARSYGHTVWFMALAADPFGPPPERPRRPRWPVEGTAPFFGPPARGRGSAPARGRGRATPAPGPAAAVALHLGGAGCGVGAALWRRLLREHGLGADGRPEGGGGPEGGAAVHFAESATGRRVPRALLADCDPAGLADALAARCFAPAGLLEGPEALRGRWGDLRSDRGGLCTAVMEGLRVQMEQADHVGCLVLTHSLTGFAGGGLAAGLMSQLAEDHAKVVRWSLALAPRPSGFSPTDCYNTLLSLYEARQHISLLTLVDNEALEALAKSKPFGLGIEAPTLGDCNGLLGQVVAAFTGPMRGGLEASNATEGWSDLQPWKAATSLVPYPRANFTFACCAPARPRGPAAPPADADDSPVLQCLEHGSMLSGAASSGKCLATGVWCRGLAQGAAVESVGRYRSGAALQAAWVPTGFAIGSQHGVPPAGPEVVALRNSTALLNKVSAPWGEAFDRHWQNLEGVDAYFESGVDAEEFREAREALDWHAKDGDELETETAEGEGDEEGGGDAF